MHHSDYNRSRNAGSAQAIVSPEPSSVRADDDRAWSAAFKLVLLPTATHLHVRQSYDSRTAVLGMKRNLILHAVAAAADLRSAAAAGQDAVMIDAAQCCAQWYTPCQDARIQDQYESRGNLFGVAWLLMLPQAPAAALASALAMCPTVQRN